MMANEEKTHVIPKVREMDPQYHVRFKSLEEIDLAKTNTGSPSEKLNSLNESQLEQG